MQVQEYEEEKDALLRTRLGHNKESSETNEGRAPSSPFSLPSLSIRKLRGSPLLLQPALDLLLHRLTGEAELLAENLSRS